MVVVFTIIIASKAMTSRQDIPFLRDMKEENSLFVLGAFFALVITGAMTTINVCDDNVDNYERTSGNYYDYAQLGGKGDSNIMFDNQAALCRGGRYMYQGNSPVAKMCQKLASTQEGQDMINQYNCPRGFIGLPKVNFEYTSNSNSCWQGIKCKGKEPE